jgi:hypothetical protein
MDDLKNLKSFVVPTIKSERRLGVPNELPLQRIF